MDKYIGMMLSGRYEILEVLGEGGMAVVYKAKCHVLNRYVAIKILRDEFAKDEEFRRRFYNESQAVAKLSHNNIVSVYDVCQSDGIDYIVMELIEGITLKEYLQKKERLQWQETLFFAEQISKALEHAHSRGIIHQDIKPQNIIILRDGTAKVTDFGIARLEGNQETRVIQEAIGSVHYISPEQAKGSTIDSRTDIYSLGVVMYEMLTGKLPFEGDTALSIVMQHINAMPLMPSEIVDGVPHGMDDIVMRAMCPNVSKRYSTAGELYSDLEALRRDSGAEFGYAEHDVRGDAPSLERTQMIPDYREAAAAPSRRASRVVEDDDRTEANIYRGSRRETAPKRQKKKSFWQRIGDSPAAMVGIAVAFFAVIAVCVGLYLFSAGGGPSKVSVPKFIGSLYEEVVSQYPEFSFEKADEVVEDDSLKAGTIVEQSVEEGEKVPRGTKIVLTIVGDPDEPKADEVILPKTFADGQVKVDTVTDWLDARDITYRLEEEDNLDIEKDMVIRTEPEAGKGVIPGEDIVKIYVSTGVSGVKRSMPTLVGLTQEKAEERLKEFKLEKDVVLEENEAEKGKVFYQSVEPGTEVDEGSTVTIKVSMGMPEINKPDPGEDKPKPPEPPHTDPGEDKPKPPAGPKTVMRDVALPQDREHVHVKVVLDDGSVVFDDTVDSSQGSITVSMTSTGERYMQVYFDGVKSAGEMVPFT